MFRIFGSPVPWSLVAVKPQKVLTFLYTRLSRLSCNTPYLLALRQSDLDRCTINEDVGEESQLAQSARALAYLPIRLSISRFYYCQSVC